MTNLEDYKDLRLGFYLSYFVEEYLGGWESFENGEGYDRDKTEMYKTGWVNAYIYCEDMSRGVQE